MSNDHSNDIAELIDRSWAIAHAENLGHYARVEQRLLIPDTHGGDHD